MTLRRGAMREALEPVFAKRGDPEQVERLRRVLLAPPPESSLGRDIAALLLAVHPAGMSCDALARRLRCRRTEILAAFRSEPRFLRVGDGGGSRWRVAVEIDVEASGTDRDGFPSADSAENPSAQVAAGERR